MLTCKLAGLVSLSVGFLLSFRVPPLFGPMPTHLGQEATPFLYVVGAAT